MFQTWEETKIKLYESFGRNEKMVQDDVNILKTWLESQPHLPEMMEDVKIRNFLNLSKFSLEKTKEKIDMYYTIRSVIPELFENSNPKLQNVKQVFESNYIFTLPTPVDNTHRVYFSKLKKPNCLKPMDVANVWFDIFELRLYEDFMVDDIVIWDLVNYTLSDMKTISPMFITKFLTTYQKVYALRLKRIIMMNSPSYISIIMAILKNVMKPKIFGRIEVYEDDAVMAEIFPKNVLLKDYGGDGPSLDEMNEMQQRNLAKYQDRFDKLDTLKVNEDLRPQKLNNDEILGYYGSFKKIDVD